MVLARYVHPLVVHHHDPCPHQCHGAHNRNMAHRPHSARSTCGLPMHHVRAAMHCHSLSFGRELLQGICEDCPDSYAPALVIVGVAGGVGALFMLLRASLTTSSRGSFGLFAQKMRAVFVALRNIGPSKIKVHLAVALFFTLSSCLSSSQPRGV